MIPFIAPAVCAPIRMTQSNKNSQVANTMLFWNSLNGQTKHPKLCWAECLKLEVSRNSSSGALYMSLSKESLTREKQTCLLTCACHMDTWKYLMVSYPKEWSELGFLYHLRLKQRKNGWGFWVGKASCEKVTRKIW